MMMALTLNNDCVEITLEDRIRIQNYINKEIFQNQGGNSAWQRTLDSQISKEG